MHSKASVVSLATTQPDRFVGLPLTTFMCTLARNTNNAAFKFHQQPETAPNMRTIACLLTIVLPICQTQSGIAQLLTAQTFHQDALFRFPTLTAHPTPINITFDKTKLLLYPLNPNQPQCDFMDVLSILAKFPTITHNTN